MLLDSLLVIEGIHLVAIVDIWDYNRDSNVRRLKKPGRGSKSLRKLRRPARPRKRSAGGHRRHAGLLARTHHQCLPEGRAPCVLREDDEQHHRRSALHGANDAGDGKIIADRPSTPQQSALYVRAPPPGAGCEALRRGSPPRTDSGTVRSPKIWAGRRRFTMSPELLANMAIRTCTSSGTGAGSRVWAVARCRIWARIRLIFSIGGSAFHLHRSWASGGVDYYKNHEWYDNAMVVYEYPLPTGMARAFYRSVDDHERRRRLFRDVSWVMKARSRCPENPSITKLLPRRSRARSGMISLQKNYLRASAVAPVSDARQGGRARTAPLVAI